MHACYSDIEILAGLVRFNGTIFLTSVSERASHVTLNAVGNLKHDTLEIIMKNVVHCYLIRRLIVVIISAHTQLKALKERQYLRQIQILEGITQSILRYFIEYLKKDTLLLFNNDF